MGTGGGGGGGGTGGGPAVETKKEWSMSFAGPVDSEGKLPKINSWWKFVGQPVEVTFQLTGQGFNGLSGYLRIGIEDQSEPIHVGLYDMVFIDLANKGKLVRIDSPAGS